MTELLVCPEDNIEFIFSIYMQLPYKEGDHTFGFAQEGSSLCLLSRYK